MISHSPSDKAAVRGEPSYVWRAGQQRRLEMILAAAEHRIQGNFLEIGCGIGLYLEKLLHQTGSLHGLEYDYARAQGARERIDDILNAAGEHLPIADDTYDLILSNEVIEHVQDDLQTVSEMIRVIKPGGRLILFCPNRWYPVETHGVYWQGKYRFGNIPFVNYLPRPWRDQLAPHVRTYSRKELEQLFHNCPVKPIIQTVIFGGYDNIINRFPRLGKLLRSFLYMLEKTPLRVLGLSHFWVLEKVHPGG